MQQLEEIKVAYEIGTLASKLNERNKAYVMNTINALLFSQQSYQESVSGNTNQN